MEEKILSKLAQLSSAFMLHSFSPPSEIEEVFNFKPAIAMDSTDSQTLSRYTIVAAQYLISLQVEFNTWRVLAAQRRKVFDRQVALKMLNDNVEGKTLKEREANAILMDEKLQRLEEEYEEAALKRDFLESLDKPITELINAIKSELKRRADERFYVHKERG